MQQTHLDPKLKPYLKKLEYSYAFGAYPVIDLFKHQPSRVMKVLLNPSGEGSDGFKDVINACDANNIPYDYNDRAIQKIAKKGNTYVVGIFQKYDSDLDPTTNHIVLDQPRNMGNIGTIIRTMVGLGYNDLAVIKPAADIFDPKVVRSAMGALFQIRFKYYDSFAEYAKEYIDRQVYCFTLNSSTDIKTITPSLPFSLVLGNESQGLGEEYTDVGTHVYIPHSKDIDSLNLSIATSIGMWEFSRAR